MMMVSHIILPMLVEILVKWSSVTDETKIYRGTWTVYTNIQQFNQCHMYVVVIDKHTYSIEKADCMV